MTAQSRLTIGFDRAAGDAVDHLAGHLEMTKGDVVNRAVKLYKLVQDDLDAGNRLAMVAPDGTVTQITLL